MLSLEQCFVLFSSFPLLLAVDVRGLGFEFCVFVAGWRHALRSEWPFIIIVIIIYYYYGTHNVRPLTLKTSLLAWPWGEINKKEMSNLILTEHQQFYFKYYFSLSVSAVGGLGCGFCVFHLWLVACSSE